MSASAQAAGNSGTAHPLPWVHVIDLHSAYLRALGHVRSGPVRGIARPAGYRPPLRSHAAGAAPAACTEPNCKLAYQNGLVQLHPRVYLLLWGPNWQTDPAQQASAAYLRRFYAGLGAEPQDTWSQILAQYSDKTGFPTFGKSVYAGSWIDTSVPPTGPNRLNFVAEAAVFASQQHLSKDLTDDQIVVATQSGTCPDGFADPNCGNYTGTYCAYHTWITSGTYTNLPVTNLPYQIDAGTGCGENKVANGTNGQYDGFSIVGGHEFAETVTDPVGSGWLDQADIISGGEIGDKCAWSYPTTSTSDLRLVTLSTGSFAMQPLFSNDTFGTPQHGCPMAAAADTLTLTTGRQASVVDTAVRYQVKAVSSASAALSFSATGLPPGLKISSAGLVTGVPTTTGTSHVAVAVDDAKGAYRAASFSWAVTTATGHLKGDHGLCARLNRSSTASGTKVVIWSCYTTASEQWTLGSGGALSAGGKCLTDPHSGGPGTGLVIEPCARASSQQWWRTLKGQYVLALNHLCLTDPGASTTAGTELKLGACITGSADVWSVP